MAYVPVSKRRKALGAGFEFSASAQASTSGGASADYSAEIDAASKGSTAAQVPVPPGIDMPRLVRECQQKGGVFIPLPTGGGVCTFPERKAPPVLRQKQTAAPPVLRQKTSMTTMALPSTIQAAAASDKSLSARWAGMSEGERALAMIGLLALVGGGVVLYAKKQRKKSQ